MAVIIQEILFKWAWLVFGQSREFHFQSECVLFASDVGTCSRLNWLVVMVQLIYLTNALCAVALDLDPMIMIMTEDIRSSTSSYSFDDKNSNQTSLVHKYEYYYEYYQTPGKDDGEK